MLFALIGLPTAAAIEGHIIDVWWCDHEIHPTPRSNLGSQFKTICRNVLYSMSNSQSEIRMANGTRAGGSGYKDPHKTSRVWPISVSFYDFMPKGGYAGRIQLLIDYCLGELDSVIKNNAYVFTSHGESYRFDLNS